MSTKLDQNPASPESACAPAHARLMASRLPAFAFTWLSFDLHDDVCRELLGISILIQLLQQRLGPMPAKTSADFGTVKQYLGETVHRVRGLAQGLQPLALRDLGLEGALRSLDHVL